MYQSEEGVWNFVTLFVENMSQIYYVFFQCWQRVGEDDEDDVDGVNGDDGREDEQKFQDLDRKIRRRREVSTKCSKKLAGFNLKIILCSIFIKRSSFLLQCR